MSVSSEKELLDTKTLIIFCIDISGSMANDKFNNPFKWTQTKQATMDCINDQKEKNPNSNITLILFNDKINVIYKNIPIQEIKCFPENITPNGCTSLCDVIISATNDLTDLKDNQRVFVVVLTDGEDTSSKTKPEHCRERIKKLQENGIEFFFLGADMDSFRAAETYGISNAANINLNKNSNIHNVTRHLSDTICHLVRTKSNIEDCPELSRAYSEPVKKINDNQTLDLPMNQPVLSSYLLSPSRQSAIAIDLYGSNINENSDEFPPIPLLSRSLSIHH